MSGGRPTLSLTRRTPLKSRKNINSNKKKNGNIGNWHLPYCVINKIHCGKNSPSARWVIWYFTQVRSIFKKKFKIICNWKAFKTLQTNPKLVASSRIRYILHLVYVGLMIIILVVNNSNTKAWVDTVTDLSQYKPSQEELEQRKLARKSNNKLLAKV